jgi:hypothetical protein
LSRFSNKGVASANEDRLVISDDEDDDEEDGETGTKTSWRAIPDSRKPQQQPSPPSSPDDRRAPRQGFAGLAGLVASGKSTTPTKTTTPPSRSLSDFVNKAKAATDETASVTPGKAQQQDGSNSRTTAPSPPANRKTQSSPVLITSHRGDVAAADDDDEDEDEDEDITSRIPGSFDLGRRGGATGTVEDDPYDVVSVLGNLWRRMQLGR